MRPLCFINMKITFLTFCENWVLHQTHFYSISLENFIPKTKYFQSLFQIWVYKYIDNDLIYIKVLNGGWLELDFPGLLFEGVFENVLKVPVHILNLT